MSATTCLLLAWCAWSAAEARPRVLVMDSGVSTATIGPGAPAHTIGLQRHRQTITLDTGARTYGLCYVVARDPKRPNVAIPGEGYIGMPEPAGCNWYAGGFFDVRLNGCSIGPTLIHSLTGRASAGRGTADFIFDAEQALVRVRFVALAGGDCLYTQLLLEPKVEITSAQVLIRCYPSAFVSDAQRHVLTATRDYAQGERADLDPARQWWTLYYDRIYDAGYVSATHRGVGPCAALWTPDEVEKAGFTVGSYGIDTHVTLRPALRDFRFVFFDWAGIKNDQAIADLRTRADALRAALASFAFADPNLLNWPLEQRHAAVRKALATQTQDPQAAARYEAWARELAALLAKLRAGEPGAIMAEAEAARIVGQWETELPTIKLRALLDRI